MSRSILLRKHVAFLNAVCIKLKVSWHIILRIVKVILNKVYGRKP